jgi:coiled-coil domain-containing protein 130
MVAKGVRFNSIKTWVGDFHSTKIYEFRMKCPQCPMRFVVRTDPENCDYLYLSGARRIFQAADCTDSSRIRDEEAQKKLRENPFAKLENEAQDRLAYGGGEETLRLLEDMQERGLEDFELNRQLRKQARGMREEEQAYFQEKRERNLSIPLLAATEEDVVIAEGVEFRQKGKMIKKEEKVTSEREKLKEKMRKMAPQFRNKLRQEIKIMNKPTSSVYLKK